MSFVSLFHKVSVLSTTLFVYFALNSSLLFSQNLVTNGDFEAGYANGWSHLANNGGVAAYSDETTTPYEGGHALKVVIDTLGSNNWDIQSIGPTVSLTTGNDYTLTFWGKAASAGTSVKAVVQDAVYLSTSKSLGTAWAKYTWTFTAQETTPNIKFQFPQTGTVWLDDVQLVDPSSGGVTITISPQTKHQTMVGFGGALSWYTQRIYTGTNATAIEQLMFEDCGVDVVRFKNWYYPDDPSSQSAFDNIIDLYNAAKSYNPEIQTLFSSWSPPASLKSNGERKNGGTLKSDVDGFMYDELAQYWVDCLDNLGWTPDYLSFQNEPGYTATWESCRFDATEGSRAEYGLAADTIWNAIKDRPNCPKMLGSEAENTGGFFTQNTKLLNRSYFDAHGYHIYDISSGSIDSASTIQKFNQIRDDYGDRPNWMTEFSKDDYDWIQAARIIHNTITEANASAYIYWKLAWDDASNDYMIGVASDGSYQVGPHFYTIKHYAKHVDKNYKRIEIGGSNTNIKVSGYLSTDKTKITLVAINKATSSEDISLSHSLSISGIEGYQSVVDNYYQTMTGLNAANPITLPAESITTLVLTLSAPYNATPVADNKSISTDQDNAVAVTLTANDTDGDPLTFVVLTQPTNGTLTGTVPDLTYTPDNGYNGNDSFTYKANDGIVDSNTATVSISVDPPNTPPTVDAGSNQTVYLTGSGAWTPSDTTTTAWFDASDASTITQNSGSVSQWADKSGNGNHSSQGTSAKQPVTGTDTINGLNTLTFNGSKELNTSLEQLTDATIYIVLEPETKGINNNSVALGANSEFSTGGCNFTVQNYSTGNPINGVFYGAAIASSQKSYNGTVASSPSVFQPGIFGHWGSSLNTENNNYRIGNKGTSPNSTNSYKGEMAEIIILSNVLSEPERQRFEGYLAHKWGLEGDLPAEHPYKSSAPQKSLATANLDGTVDDVDGDPLTTAWSKLSGPGVVIFGNESAIDTTATFDTAGVYVLTLTADDGTDQTSHNVTITVSETYPHWSDSDNDWSISQTEIESVISLYQNNSNTNNVATTQTGDITSGRITMREVMRVIYLFNNGGTYIGGQTGTVDGYDVAAQGAPATAPPAPTTAKVGSGLIGDDSDGSLVVLSNADSGAGSLRDAIAMAADGETITIDDSLDTITLLSEIVIDKSITIDGLGAAIVSGEKQTRIFRIENDSEAIDVTIQNIGIVDAANASDEFGGAIYNNAQTLNINTLLFDKNSNSFDTGKGGAVYSSGKLNIENCVFRNNEASEHNDVYSENGDENY